MAADGPNRTRRADLKTALKRTKVDDYLTLEEVALLWGTTKQRFVTVRNQMPTFPQPVPGQGNVYLYPARQAVQAMLDYETRHDEAAAKRAARTAAILGREDKHEVEDVGAHTVNELATLSRMRAELEQQEVDQGKRVEVEINARVAGVVFAKISEFMSGMSNRADPHGLLPPETRKRIDDQASKLLLELHRDMRDVLSADAKPVANRTTTRRPGKARTRR